MLIHSAEKNRLAQMTADRPKDKISEFWGSVVPLQHLLTEKFRSLHESQPHCNDIMLNLDENSAVIFDGIFWREFDLEDWL